MDKTVGSFSSCSTPRYILEMTSLYVLHVTYLITSLHAAERHMASVEQSETDGSSFVRSLSTCPRSCTCQTSQIVVCKETVDSSNCNNTPLTPLYKLLPVDIIDLQIRVLVENKHQNVKSANTSRCTALYFASMTSLPILPNLRRLDLSGNSIADTRLLPADNSSLFIRFRSSPLKFVNLTGNSLQRLRLGAFADLQLVEQLDLSGNQISRLEPGCFFGLRQLKVLKMTANAISQIDTTIFDGLTHLSTLFLDENRLTTVDVGRLLWSLSCLDSLYLSRNKINRAIVDSELPERDRGRRRMFDVGTAASASSDGDDGECLRQHLEFLDLSHNKIVDWPFQTEYNKAEADHVQQARSTRPDMLHIRNLVLDENPIRLLTMIPSLPPNDDVANRKRYAVIGSVERLSVSSMPEMIGVDLSTFDLLFAEPKRLVELAMHDNQKLRYVDRSRDLVENGQSSLSRLYAHNNNLTTVSRQVLAGLQTVSLYGNPLYCDCHLSWFQDVFGYSTRRRSSTRTSLGDRPSKTTVNFNSVRLLDANETRCAGPANISGLTIPEAVQLGWFVSLPLNPCPPRVVPLFDATTLLPLSSDLVLDCRVLVFSANREDGASRQSYSSEEVGGVTWMTPAIADRERRVNILRHPGRGQSGSALIVKRVRARDAGAYRCIAAGSPTDAGNNSLSIATPSAQTVLRLYSVSAGTFPVAIGSRSVTVIWNGTESTLTTSDYVIVYQPLPMLTSVEMETPDANAWSQFCGGYRAYPPSEQLLPQQHRSAFRCNGSADAESGAILVRPFLRKYTVGGLQPNSAYQFCMAVRSADSGSRSSTKVFAPHELIRLNCINITTRPEILDAGRWFSTGSGFTLAIIVFGAMTSLACVACTSALRFRRRKWYSEPEVVIVRGETASASLKLTAGLRRGPSKVVKYGLPLDDLTGTVAVGIMSTTSAAAGTPSTQRTSLVTDCSNTMMNYRNSLSNSTTSLVGSLIQ